MNPINGSAPMTNGRSRSIPVQPAISIRPQAARWSSLASALAVTALAAPASGQQLIHSISQSDTMSGHFGYAVANVGDVDGDGVTDVGIGAPGGWRTSPGRAFVHSGADGRLLHSWSGTDGRHGFGVAIDGVGDVDGDGKSDVLVGAFDWHTNLKSNVAGYAVVRSGATGAVLFTLEGEDPREHFGWRVLGLGDVDGDAKPEFAVASPGSDCATGSRVRVYSGETGKCLYSIRDPGLAHDLGFALARAGDLDRDGKPDLVIGAPTTTPGGFVGAYSGADGKALFTIRGSQDDRALGSSVAGGVDFDGDGKPDLIVGAATAGERAWGRVRIYSGADRSVLVEVAGSPAFIVGYQALALPDRNGDGKPELLIADPGRGLCRVYSISSPDRCLQEIHAPRGDLDRSFGFAVAIAPGESGDERTGLLCGADWGRETDGANPDGRAILMSIDGYAVVRTFAPQRP